MLKIIPIILVGSSKQTTIADSRGSWKSALLRVTEFSDDEIENCHNSLCGLTILLKNSVLTLFSCKSFTGSGGFLCKIKTHGSVSAAKKAA